jgi:DNA invertase Pin-like site-specific DNA recombinase
MNKFYDTETERLMVLHSSRLGEKDCRHYAAVEAMKLGYGGKRYITRLLSISSRTLYKGISELADKEKYAEIPVDKERRTGGGRKKNFAPSLTSDPI